MSFHQQIKNKILTTEEAMTKVTQLQAQGKTVVLTNGCFDILHPGHIHLLAGARDAGDHLIVALNSDSSVRALNKAPNRPINPQAARACLLAALASVDSVIIFDEPTPLALITLLKPNILVKGGDYTTQEIVGQDVVRAAGGTVITIPLLEGHSSTSIITKITQS